MQLNFFYLIMLLLVLCMYVCVMASVDPHFIILEILQCTDVLCNGDLIIYVYDCV